MQGWMQFWFDEQKRLTTAKKFQKACLKFMRDVWQKDKELHNEGFYCDDEEIETALKKFAQDTELATDVNKLLMIEAQLAKHLYRYTTRRVNYGEFVRDHKSADKANVFLNHGNYLAYGLAATTLWVLGISHSFAVMHGKTRRGALVFDVADLIKDTLVLPWAFICAKDSASAQEFRQQCLQVFTQHKALDYMFNTVKEAAHTS